MSNVYVRGRTQMSLLIVVCVVRRVEICNMTFLCMCGMCHDSFVCVVARVEVCDMTRWCVSGYVM